MGERGGEGFPPKGPPRAQEPQGGGWKEGYARKGPEGATAAAGRQGGREGGRWESPPHKKNPRKIFLPKIFPEGAGGGGEGPPPKNIPPKIFLP